MDGSTDVGVPHAHVLLAFADAAIAGNVEGARAAVIAAMGQAAMIDAAAVIVNGRLSYEGQAKSPLRKRLVVTRSVAGLEPDPDNPNARLWNPAGADLDALQELHD